MQRVCAFHTVKTIEAVKASIGLFKLPSSLMKHSPLVICALALAIMAEVSAHNNVLNQERLCLEARERIRLGLGVLKTYDTTWQLGRRSMSEVKAVARTLLGISVPSKITPPRSQSSPFQETDSINFSGIDNVFDQADIFGLDEMNFSLEPIDCGVNITH